ncbi:unnamed protein product [Lampetra fluviatilis]
MKATNCRVVEARGETGLLSHEFGVSLFVDSRRELAVLRDPMLLLHRNQHVRQQHAHPITALDLTRAAPIESSSSWSERTNTQVGGRCSSIVFTAEGAKGASTDLIISEPQTQFQFEI